MWTRLISRFAPTEEDDLTVNWIELFTTCREFFRAHQLMEWAEAIPPQPPQDLDLDPGVRTARESGFREAFVFPPFSIQMQTLDRLVEATARKPTARLPDNQQYSGDVFLADTWTKTANGKVLQRDDHLVGRTENPYLLLYNPNPIAKVWGRTGRQIVDFFADKYWNGLTIPEYFVLQRTRAEKWGDHRFFDDPGEGHVMHWLWLIDSMTATECSVAMTGARCVNVQACPVGNREARRAAIASMVFPLESV